MSSKTKAKLYVMFGCNRHDEDDTAYFGEQNKIVTDIDAARRFSTKPSKGQKGFGTPQQWLDFINADETLCQGYKFHLVNVNF